MKTLQADLVKSEIMRRGMSLMAFAASAGLDYGSLRNLLSGASCSARIRILVEKALGRAFWSSKSELSRAATIEKSLGVDPRFATFRTLQRTATRFGVRGWTKAATKAALIEFLYDHLLTEKVCRKAPEKRKKGKRE